jgi:HEAT repeat protein
MLNEHSRRSHFIERFFGLATAVLLAAFFVSSARAQSGSNLTPRQKAIQLQSQRLNSGNDEDRRDALIQLKAMRAPEAARACLPGLTDPNPMVRAVAASAVSSLPADEAVPALLPLLADKDEFVRREVVYALGHTRSRKATSTLIELLQTDKEESVRAAAVVGLGEIGDETAVVPLSGILSGPAKGKREQNVFILRAAAEALGLIGSRAGVPALIATLSNDRLDSDIRREAAQALGRIGDPAAVPVLHNAASATDPYLASTAVDALKMISR